MDELGVLGELPVADVGDGGEVGVLGGGGEVGGHVLARSAYAFLPHAPVRMKSATPPSGAMVHGDGGELGGRTALEEQNLSIGAASGEIRDERRVLVGGGWRRFVTRKYRIDSRMIGAGGSGTDLVVGGDADELAEVGLGLLGDLHEVLAAVGHLHDGHAGALVVDQVLLASSRTSRAAPRGPRRSSTCGRRTPGRRRRRGAWRRSPCGRSPCGRRRRGSRGPRRRSC